jgi:energy-coupling factor transport system ATP-binding protein
MTGPVILIEGLSYAYEPQARAALAGIDLRVERGEFVGIIGENGAGKTTLLKHLVGLLRPTAGRVFVDGLDATKLAVSELATHVGFVLQNPDQQLFAQTVEEEVAFGPRNLHLDPRDIQKRVDGAIAATGLEAFRNEFPPALPRGERAKVVIASVVAMRPDIVILDEPTTGQDYKGCHQMMCIARQLHHEGHTVLVVTHDMALIAEYAARTVVLHQGRILLDDTTAAVFARPELLQRTHVTPPQITQLSQNLPPRLGLLPTALTVEEMGQSILERDKNIKEEEK